MISPTARARPSSIPTVSSRPGTNRSIMTSSSYCAARVDGRVVLPLAAFTTVSPTVDPCLEGFTTTGHPNSRPTVAASTGAITQSAVGTPAIRNRRLEMSLSMAMALPRRPLPV